MERKNTKSEKDLAVKTAGLTRKRVPILGPGWLEGNVGFQFQVRPEERWL